QYNAIHAYPGSLQRGDLVGFLKQSKGDQHGEQHAERSGVVEKIWRHGQQILSDHDAWDAVDVLQQFEKREHQDQGQEGSDDNSEIHEEVTEDVIVDEERESRAEHALASDRALERSGLALLSDRKRTTLQAIAE